MWATLKIRKNRVSWRVFGVGGVGEIISRSDYALFFGISEE
jgi:hypothetical protein